MSLKEVIINEGAVLGLEETFGRRSMEEEEGDEEGMGGRITIHDNDGEKEEKGKGKQSNL